MSVVFVFPFNLENNNYHNSSEAGTSVLLISGLSVDLHLLQIYRQFIRFLFNIPSYSAGINLIKGSSIITKSAHIGYRYQVFHNKRNFTQKFRHLNTCRDLTVINLFIQIYSILLNKRKSKVNNHSIFVMYHFL